MHPWSNGRPLTHTAELQVLTDSPPVESCLMRQKPVAVDVREIESPSFVPSSFRLAWLAEAGMLQSSSVPNMAIQFSGA